MHRQMCNFAQNAGQTVCVFTLFFIIPVRQLLAKFNSFCSFELIGAAGCWCTAHFSDSLHPNIDGFLVVVGNVCVCFIRFPPNNQPNTFDANNADRKRRKRGWEVTSLVQHNMLFLSWNMIFFEFFFFIEVILARFPHIAALSYISLPPH